MTNIVDYDSAIADRVRAERAARGWSIAELAEKSGISKAMISRVERNEANPTASLLLKIATAFGLTMASFFSRVEDGSQNVSRKAQQNEWVDPETGYRRRQVLAQHGFPLEITEIEMPPGQQIGFAAASYAYFRQAVWVQSGPLHLFESQTWHALNDGDCLAFGPPSEVIFANKSDHVSRYTVFISRI